MASQVKANYIASDHMHAKGDSTVESTKATMFRICEVLMLTLVMVIIVGLFLIPTIVYALTSVQVRVIYSCKMLRMYACIEQHSNSENSLTNPLRQWELSCSLHVIIGSAWL